MRKPFSWGCTVTQPPKLTAWLRLACSGDLNRVFPPANTANGNGEQEETQETANKTPGLSLAVEHLRELLRRTERECDELGRRLDEEAAERRQNAAEIRRLALMLTHDKQPEPKADTPPEPASQGRLWEKLFGRR